MQYRVDTAGAEYRIAGNFCEFHSFVAIRESFLSKVLGCGIFWHGKNEQSAKVFSFESFPLYGMFRPFSGLISWSVVTYVNCTVHLHSTAISNTCIYICVPYPPMSTLASSMCQWHHLWPALDVSGSCKLASIGVEARKASLVSWWVSPWLCSDNTGVSVDGSSPWVTELGTVLGTVSPPDLRVRVWPSSAAFLYRLNI